MRNSEEAQKGDSELKDRIGGCWRMREFMGPEKVRRMDAGPWTAAMLPPLSRA